MKTTYKEIEAKIGEGFPSVEECQNVWGGQGFAGIVAVRNLLLSSFAKQMEEKDKEITDLKDWKESMMSVESQWDEQKVARLLGMTAGQDIRKNIESKILELQAKLAAIASLPEKWRKIDNSQWWPILNACSQGLESALSPLPVAETPPAGKLSDEQIIEKAIEMVNTPGTTKDSLPHAINAKIVERDSFHAETIKKLDEERKIAANRLVAMQELRAENSKQAERLAALDWRPVSVKPTGDDTDIEGYVFVCEASGKSRGIHRIDCPFHDGVTHWFPFPKLPAPTKEESRRAKFEQLCAQFDVSFTRDEGGNYRDSRTLVLFEVWMLALASKEVTA